MNKLLVRLSVNWLHLKSKTHWRLNNLFGNCTSRGFYHHLFVKMPHMHGKNLQKD